MNAKITETVKGRKPELNTYLTKFLTKHTAGKYGVRIPQTDINDAIAQLQSIKGLVPPVVVEAVVVAPVEVTPVVVETAPVAETTPAVV